MSRSQKQINKQVKDWLWRYREAKIAIRRLEGEYEELVSIQESAGSIKYDDMPHGSSSNPDLSNLIIVRDQSMTKLIKAKSRAVTAYSEIMNAIEQLDKDVEKEIISLRYVQLHDNLDINSMNDIANIIKYSPDFVKRSHGIALTKLGRIVFPSEKWAL